MRRFDICLITFVLFALSIGFASVHETGNINHDDAIMENSSSLDGIVLQPDSNIVGTPLSDISRDIQNLKPGEVYNLDMII